MKTVIITLFFSFFLLTTKAQQKDTTAPDSSKPVQIVDAACGQCRLGLPGNSCDLAVRINGKAYFVDGSGIDSHGDAHASDGFCNAVRKAKVQGEIVGDRFKATYFSLVPEAPKKKRKSK